jgi:hypothetical protein
MDEVGDATNGVDEYTIGDGKRVFEAHVRAREPDEALIGDHDE